MNSIRLRLWAGMMILVLFVLVLLWLFQIVFLEKFYTDMRISNVKSEITVLTELLQDGRQEEFKNSLEKFTFSNNLSAEWLDSQGRPIYITGPMGSSGQMPMMKNNIRAGIYQDVLNGKTMNVLLNHPRFGNKFVMLGMPLKADGRVIGAVVITMPLAPVEETASILKQQLFYITLILLTTALFLSFFIAKNFTKPILEIKQAAELMAAGNFSVNISRQRGDEIGALAASINYLGRQLSKIEQLRKDLIANVSHELRTPLSLIQGYAETIKDISGNNPDKREKHLEIIIEEVKRLSHMVDDILNLSQLQSGCITLHKTRFTAKDILSAVISRYEVLSEKTGVKILSQVDEFAEAEADKDKIAQVLYNLINNAFQHTDAGGQVTVRALNHANAVRMEVSDTGSGIAPEELPYIWNKYYKNEKGKGSTAGTGLGLAIVKSILDVHQAAFGVISRKNEGTTIWFELKKYNET